MVEDTGDCGMYEEDKEGKAEGGMEWDSNRNERAEDKHVGGDWQRGRRKQQWREGSFMYWLGVFGILAVVFWRWINPLNRLPFDERSRQKS